MGKFLNGLFIGIGVGLFIAPQTGEETRRIIRERIVALRRSMLSEDEQAISIDAHPPQISPFSAEPARPATEFFNESEDQGTPNIPQAQSATDVISEPKEQSSSNVSLAPPIATFVRGPEEQECLSVPSPEALSTLSNQSADVIDSNGDITDTAQTSDAPTNPAFVPDANPDQQDPAEMPRSDTAITEKLPPLSSSSNMPGRTTKRKASTRTPNTSKTKGHSRS